MKKGRFFYCRHLFTHHTKELRMFSCVTIQSCMKSDRNQLSPLVKSWRSYMVLFKVDKSFTAVIFQVTWKLRRKDLHQQQLQQPSLPSSPKLPLPWLPGPPWQTRTTVRLTTSFSSVATSSRSMNPRLWRRAVGRRPCVFVLMYVYVFSHAIPCLSRRPKNVFLQKNSNNKRDRVNTRVEGGLGG